MTVLLIMRFNEHAKKKFKNKTHCMTAEWSLISWTVQCIQLGMKF